MVTPHIIRIATRQSPLALWQAEYVKAALEKAHSGLTVKLLPMTTRGDKVLDSPLAKIGGKGLFIKELEVAMLEGRADIAVHSMKDVPMDFPLGLGLAVICEREDCRDAFVSNKVGSFHDLPEGAVVGSSSLRRQCQLRALRPDITIRDLRGNVNTRLAKLDAGEFDAIILASAGLIRLGMADRITEHLDTDTCLPAGGQGAVGIECNTNDDELMGLLKVLTHEETTSTVLAERAMNRRLNGGCQVPIACLAEITEVGLLKLRGLVGDAKGEHILRTEVTGMVEDAEALGEQAGDELIARGADKLLASLMDS